LKKEGRRKISAPFIETGVVLLALLAALIVLLALFLHGNLLLSLCG
jgi:hypothetical protein